MAVHILIAILIVRYQHTSDPTWLKFCMAVNGFSSKILTLYFFQTPVNVRREKKTVKNGTIKQAIICPYRKKHYL